MTQQQWPQWLAIFYAASVAKEYYTAAALDFEVSAHWFAHWFACTVVLAAYVATPNQKRDPVAFASHWSYCSWMYLTIGTMPKHINNPPLFASILQNFATIAHMSLSVGIIGLPNVGKSTLFNAITKSTILAANYPFATIEPNTGIVAVPDERLTVLQNMYNAEKILPATITFVDIAGLVAGASKGEGLGNKFLANIRECDALIHVVRAFRDNDVVRHDNSTVDPRNDIETINTELILADIQSIQNHLPKLQKEAKANPKKRGEVAALEAAEAHLSAGKPLYGSDLDVPAQLPLLTAKPIIYVFNIDETDLTNNTYQTELSQLVTPAPSLCINAKLESELASLDDAEAADMLAMYGIDEPGLTTLARSAYTTLGLQSYLTAGPKEVRAWTIPRGATAPQAAGVIHTDFERGFIAASIVDYDDLVAAGSEQAARAAGNVRTEGKTYVMQPGDVVEFRFNV